MIRIRSDLRFFFITKRIDRLMQVLPPDWGKGYENLAVGCTVENQAMADYRLPLLLNAPLRHKLVICAPLLGPLDIARYLTPGSKRYPSGANRATKPAPAITTGCFRSAASASRQTFPSLSTKPARGLSRTGAFTASAARTSIRRPARPGSTTRQSDKVSSLSALHELRHPILFPRSGSRLFYNSHSPTSFPAGTVPACGKPPLSQPRHRHPGIASCNRHPPATPQSLPGIPHPKASPELFSQPSCPDTQPSGSSGKSNRPGFPGRQIRQLWPLRIIRLPWQAAKPAGRHGPPAPCRAYKARTCCPRQPRRR